MRLALVVSLIRRLLLSKPALRQGFPELPPRSWLFFLDCFGRCGQNGVAAMNLHNAAPQYLGVLDDTVLVRNATDVTVIDERLRGVERRLQRVERHRPRVVPLIEE